MLHDTFICGSGTFYTEDKIWQEILLAAGNVCVSSRVPRRWQRPLQTGCLSQKSKHSLLVVETDESKFCVACRDVERSVPEDYHDWHADCTPVVHLWLCEGLLPPATSSTTRDAGISEEEAGCSTAAVAISLWNLVIVRLVGKIVLTFVFIKTADQFFGNDVVVEFMTQMSHIYNWACSLKLIMFSMLSVRHLWKKDC